MRWYPLLIFACSAVFTACCGGGKDKPGSSPSGGTSERTWAAQVNAVCRGNKAEVGKIVAKIRAEGLGQREASAALFDRSVPVERRLLDRIGKVPAPKALQAAFGRFVGRLRATLPLFPDIAATVRANKTNPELSTKLLQIAADTRPFATQHKLLACLPDAS
ncbi:MAG: hypothetical protein ACR2NB_04165 [Solirubrobacteraceae bacterium]